MTSCRLAMRKVMLLTSCREFFKVENISNLYMSQGLLGLCCSIETRDRIAIITITAVLFK